MILLEASAKNAFFDRVAVQRAMDKVTHGFLSHFGGYTRKVARNSIKALGKRQLKRLAGATSAQRAMLLAAYSSKPGDPPKSHTGLLKRILYAYERTQKRVVVGPERLNQKSTRGGRTAPELLEYGGTVPSQPGVLGAARGKMLTYEPRPYMRPAFEAALKKQDDFWKDAAGSKTA